jgi:hypothetical protein
LILLHLQHYIQTDSVQDGNQPIDTSPQVKCLGIAQVPVGSVGLKTSQDPPAAPDPPSASSRESAQDLDARAAAPSRAHCLGVQPLCAGSRQSYALPPAPQGSLPPRSERHGLAYRTPREPPTRTRTARTGGIRHEAEAHGGIQRPRVIQRGDGECAWCACDTTGRGELAANLAACAHSLVGKER